jgi:hypothetical protein
MHVGQDGKKLLKSKTSPTQDTKLGNSLDTSGQANNHLSRPSVKPNADASHLVKLGKTPIEKIQKKIVS